MNIKELLAKISKDEALTDEEKAFVAAYDPDKVVNSTAAAARKSAEAKLREKEADLEKLKADIAALQCPLRVGPRELVDDESVKLGLEYKRRSYMRFMP